MKNTVVQKIRSFTDRSNAKFASVLICENETDRKAIQLYFENTTCDKTKYGRICVIVRCEKDVLYCESLHGCGYSIFDDVKNELNSLLRKAGSDERIEE